MQKHSEEKTLVFIPILSTMATTRRQKLLFRGISGSSRRGRRQVKRPEHWQKTSDMVWNQMKPTSAHSSGKFSRWKNVQKHLEQRRSDNPDLISQPSIVSGEGACFFLNHAGFMHIVVVSGVQYRIFGKKRELRRPVNWGFLGSCFFSVHKFRVFDWPDLCVFSSFEWRFPPGEKIRIHTCCKILPVECKILPVEWTEQIFPSPHCGHWN